LKFNTGMHCPCIFLIDDHPLFRSGLRMIIQNGLSDSSIHEMDSVEAALQKDEQPDLVLLDIFLAGMDGLSGIALIKDRWPQANLTVVSSDASGDTVKRALDTGANAFLSKAQSPSHMLDAIKEALSCHLHLPQASGESLALSDRQQQVLDLLVQGMSNRMIGQRLFLSEHTIRWHVQGLLEALGASSRTEAVFLARRKGLIK